MTRGLLLLFCGALAAQSPSKFCSLEGRVVNEITGKPVKDATLKLHRSDGSQSIFSTVSDDAGNFAFAGIEPGQYDFSAERMGFVSSNFGARRPRAAGTPITLAPGQTAAGFEIKLTPQGAIAGRVFDADGEPARGGVSILRQQYVNGRKQLKQMGGGEIANYGGAGAAIDDQGKFRLFGLAAGRYYIKAIAGGSELEAVAQDRSATPHAEGYVPTYYPSTADVQAAKAVEVTAGATATGIDIALVRAPVTDVRGHLSELPPAWAGRVSVAICDADGVFVRGGAVKPQTGEFEIRWPVAAGRYWLITSLVRNNAPWYFSKQALDVTGPSAMLDATMGNGFEVHGTVRVEDSGRRIDLRSLRVTLRPWDLALREDFWPNATASADGSFAFDMIGPDRYVVNVTGVPAGVYLKSIRSGDRDVLEKGLDMTRESAAVEIVVSGKPGTIEGTVRADDEKPAVGATVALVPDGAAKRLRPDWYRSATCDAEGRFHVENLAPGEYKLFVWDEVEDGAWMDAEFLKPIEGRGTAVTVREGGTETVLLKLRP